MGTSTMGTFTMAFTMAFTMGNLDQTAVVLIHLHIDSVEKSDDAEH